MLYFPALLIGDLKYLWFWLQMLNYFGSWSIKQAGESAACAPGSIPESSFRLTDSSQQALYVQPVTLIVLRGAAYKTIRLWYFSNESSKGGIIILLKWWFFTEFSERNWIDVTVAGGKGEGHSPSCCCRGGFALEQCRVLESGFQCTRSQDPCSSCPGAGPSTQAWLFPFRKSWVYLVTGVTSSWVKENVLGYQSVPIWHPCGDFLCASSVILSSHTVLGVFTLWYLKIQLIIKIWTLIWLKCQGRERIN